ncbi:hypothetical protein BW721_08280 [Jeotgalibaca sp. PTS2502]|uniref:hypothetical protein n=1 Tax=Jeotgalibaca sp. PTS2502 TaxID=1903686 RepID=UPI000973B14E|nr:hypothetical protein [Jeotgalibaca sp. PTS2502]APZ49654.1 hypothetical protein BW721_08280 [Jeotgalibaca sp. PTS2502]
MSNRLTVLEEMNHVLDSWDNQAESGADIIQQMKPLIEGLKGLPNDPYTVEEDQLLKDIYKKETRLVSVMEVAREEIAQELIGLNKNKTAAQHYVYSKQTPIFVNQEL